MRLSLVDIYKNCFNAIPERAMYIKLPKEMGLNPDHVARQARCVYGIRIMCPIDVMLWDKRKLLDLVP